MNRGPELWSHLLKSAPKGSILMGGAIVDFSFYWGEAKDYDIFYVSNQLQDIPVGWKYVKPLDFQKQQDEYLAGAGQATNPILQVDNYDVTVENSVVRVQLIHLDLDKPQDHFQNFDHSLTLGLFSSNGLFIHRKVFESIQNKTVELINKNNPAKSLERAHRKVLKYDPHGAADWKYNGWE